MRWGGTLSGGRKRFTALLAVVSLLVLAGTGALTGGRASASGLVLHAEPATLGNGDDYATNVLHDPWDMSEVTDLGWWENYANITADGGVWSATTSVTNPNGGASGLFYPLFHGFATALNPGKTGSNFPIDTTRYTQLSYRLYLDHRRGAHAVYWTHQVSWPTGREMFAFADSSPDGWKIYNFDMNATNGDLYNQRGSWSSSPVYGFNITPSAFNPAVMVKTDWIRLTDPSTSPRYHLSWSGAAADSNIEVHVTDAQGQDLGKVATVSGSAGSYDFPTCILPGGVYYFFLKDGANNRSANAGSLTINDPPVIRWNSSATGEDYATTELGNPWDMSGAEDVATLQGPLASDNYYNFRQFYNWDLTDGVFSATADSAYAYNHYGNGLRQTDVQVWMNIDPNLPIDPSKYHHMVLRIMVDNPNDYTLAQLVEDGWVCRLVWWNEGIHIDGYASDGWVLYPGWNTITLDLSRLGTPMSNDPYPANRLWRDMGQVLHFRIDPVEVSMDTRFYIDEVRLLSDPVAHGSFPANLGVSDPEGQPVTVRYYYDTLGYGFNGQELTGPASAPGMVAQSQGERHVVYLPWVTLNPRPRPPLLPDEPGLSRVSRDLDVSGLATGTYFFYACASDGISQTCTYLPNPVSVSQ